MRRLVVLAILSLFAAFFAFSADIAVEAGFDLSGVRAGDGFFSLKATGASLQKEQVDVTTGASRQRGTAIWNTFRVDPKGKPAIGYGLHGLFKFGFSAASQFQADLPRARKGADGVIVVEYLHRGTAYQLRSDSSGLFKIPGSGYKSRKIGYIDSKGVNVIHPDFSANGLVSGIDYAKVWDEGIADGKVVNNQAGQKTGKVIDDVGTSSMFLWTGGIQVTLEGSWLGLKGELNAEAPAR